MSSKADEIYGPSAPPEDPQQPYPQNQYPFQQPYPQNQFPQQPYPQNKSPQNPPPPEYNEIASGPYNAPSYGFAQSSAYAPPQMNAYGHGVTPSPQPPQSIPIQSPLVNVPIANSLPSIAGLEISSSVRRFEIKHRMFSFGNYDIMDADSGHTLLRGIGSTVNRLVTVQNARGERLAQLIIKGMANRTVEIDYFGQRMMVKRKMFGFKRRYTIMDTYLGELEGTKETMSQAIDVKSVSGGHVATRFFIRNVFCGMPRYQVDVPVGAHPFPYILLALGMEATTK
eukprot:GCRY01002968.1.p1 GENE.GCRY01002968.1~~GCRY01002968.1.p1  ORF type:complete len:313 (+),score=43.64 GCRY01002968.1:93-941(+)